MAESPSKSNIHIIVDLDGTICNNSERAKTLDVKSAISWKKFFEKCESDQPIEPILNWIQLLGEICNIDIITGRPDYVRKQTIAWLKTHNIRFDTLWMRKYSDTMKSSEYKAIKLKQLTELFPNDQFVLAFEDDEQCIEMYKEFGLTVIDPKPFTSNRDVGSDLSQVENP